MITFSREAITILGFSIHWYGILIAVGIWGGIEIATRREKRYGLPEESVISMALWAIPAAIVCARLYFVAFSWDAYKDDLMGIFRLRQGGMAIYGGVIGGAAAGILYARAKRLPVPALADIAAPALAFGQAVGRWGNFLNQEAYGVLIENPKWQFFPAAVLIRSRGGWYAATFFYESAWCALICAFLLILERKRTLPRGQIALTYLALYGAERVLVEGLRLDSLYLGSVRVSQLLSALVLTVCALYFALSRKKSAARRISVLLTALFAVGLISGALGASLPGWTLVGCALGAVILTLTNLLLPPRDNY